MGQLALLESGRVWILNILLKDPAFPLFMWIEMKEPFCKTSLHPQISKVFDPISTIEKPVAHSGWRVNYGSSNPRAKKMGKVLISEEPEAVLSRAKEESLY